MVKAKGLFEEKKVNRVTYSGKRSLHCRVSLEDIPETLEQYKFVWDRLNELLFEGKADRACSNPARLTKKPFAVRQDNGVEQKALICLSKSVSDFQ